MLFEVKIYSPEGELKKVINRTQLSQRHWEKFKNDEEKVTFANNDRPRVPKWIKEKLDLEFPEIHTSSLLP